VSFTELKRVASALIDEVAHAAIKGNVASVYFLRATLLIFSFSSLLFFITPESSHNRYANVAASLAGLVLCVLAYRRSWYIPILHITGLLILALTLYAAAYAGGINAIVLIWLTTLPLMALIVGGPKIGMFWFLAVQVILFGVWLATHIGIIDSTVPKGNGLIFGIMLNWLLCLISPFMVLWLYDLLQNKRSTLIQIDNQKLDLAQQELRTLQAHKDEFIAAIGHELRTPMGVILGLNNLLQDQLKDKPEELEAAGHIRTSTLQLLDLINNILDFSQLQAGLMKMRPTAVNVVECLQTAFNQHRELAESKQIQINLHTNALEHTHFFIDPHRFEQVAGNLIKNGLQHARTKVWVSAHSSTFESKAGFTIQVHDDGPGPDPEDHPYLFNQFMDHQHLDRFCDQGAGLGLAVCKLITDLQHGQIGLRHHHGEPTCFWFTWPAALANKKRPGP
jgi:signal transduction histidine kinase